MKRAVRKISKILVRSPSSRLDLGLVSHVERVAIDNALAKRQWAGYIEVLRSAAGCDVVEVAEAEHLPDGVFVEDVVVWVNGFSPPLAIVTNPGNDLRKPEVSSVQEALLKLSLPGLQVRRIEAPGTLDGGDVLQLADADVIYVGQSSRTNAEGIAQFQSFVGAGKVVQSLPVRKVLHLKSVMTALADGELLVWDGALDAELLGLLTSTSRRLTKVTEEAGAHVVVINDKTLILSAAAPKTAALLRGRGFIVYTTDITEFEKLEGCVTCLSVRLRE